ncbi:MAG TPA: substrate-binding domain-containing protein [Tepidisphaeraceae bacterium]|jgi:LacI family transcriptional regulator|nr:substrate-binding domain-containing protein [Tepidisphaeraceae bacterium]
MGADHLLQRGFQRFGFCGFSSLEYSTRRRDWYLEYLREKGYSAHTYDDQAADGIMTTSRRESDAMLHENELSDWLASIAKPIGIMACNDVRGRQVLSACRTMGISVPDEIAVIGVDNDDILCDLSIPPLSSVIPATERIGFEAASLLDKMLDGERLAANDVTIEPLGVMVRLSTDVLAVEDRQVAAALRFIREHACRGIKGV